jgi:hypothetical protein
MVNEYPLQGGLAGANDDSTHRESLVADAVSHLTELVYNIMNQLGSPVDHEAKVVPKKLIHEKVGDLSVSDTDKSSLGNKSIPRGAARIGKPVTINKAYSSSDRWSTITKSDDVEKLLPEMARVASKFRTGGKVKEQLRSGEPFFTGRAGMDDVENASFFDEYLENTKDNPEGEDIEGSAIHRVAAGALMGDKEEKADTEKFLPALAAGALAGKVLSSEAEKNKQQPNQPPDPTQQNKSPEEEDLDKFLITTLGNVLTGGSDEKKATVPPEIQSISEKLKGLGEDMIDIVEEINTYQKTTRVPAKQVLAPMDERVQGVPHGKQ